MEIKELLKRLEEDLDDKEEAGEPTGDYILIAGRKEGLQVSGKHNTDLLTNGIWKLFEILKEKDKAVSLKLFAMLCAQTLAEHLQGKGE
ncbi:MAG: hypothetical protein ACLT3C_00775 [Peptococcus niger]